jgi:hypothetical protein
MTTAEWAAGLYLLNFALLVTHQIDSAYWREWEMFRMPGGLQLNLVLNFLLALLALGGFVLVLGGTSIGHWAALVLAAAGLAAFTIHAVFLLKGSQAFRTPVSLAVLTGALIVSLVQATQAISNLMG